MSVILEIHSGSSALWKAFVFGSHFPISKKRIKKKITALIHYFSQLIYVCEAFKRK